MSHQGRPAALADGAQAIRLRVTMRDTVCRRFVDGGAYVCVGGGAGTKRGRWVGRQGLLSSDGSSSAVPTQFFVI